MPGCPFGFHAAEAAEDDAPADTQKKDSGGKCPFSGKAAQDEDGKVDDRFDYNKDPVSWFYQNQIKSEEDFQAKKSALREEAKRRLENIFERKGKNVVWELDLDDDDCSISSSELSAWDSDVESVCSMVSCANDWIESYQFPSNAATGLKYACGAALVVIVNCLRVAWLSYSNVKHFWGVVDYKWAPAGSIFVSFLALVCITLGMQAWICKSKRYLLGMQLTTHVLFTSSLALGLISYMLPSQVSEQIKDSACQRYKGSEHVSRMCELIPSIDLQLKTSCEQVVQSMGLVALLSLGLMMMGTWYQWELAHVEKKAIKHKRRYRRRKNTIPWHKLKIDGPMTFCGANPPPAEAAGADAPAAEGGAKDKDI